MATCIFAAALAGCPTTEPEPTCAGDELMEEDGTCVPAACGLGPWGDVGSGDDEVRYVAPWGRGGGAGTSVDPMDDPTEAFEELAEDGGGRLVLAAGRYEEVNFNPEIHGLEIRGRCAELVEVVGLEDPDWGALDAFNGSVDVRGVTFSDPSSPPITVFSPGLGSTAVDLRDVIIDGALHGGIYVDGSGAMLDARRLTIRNITDDAVSTSGAIVVIEGVVTVEDSLIEDVEGLGVGAQGSAAFVDLTGVTISGTGDGIEDNSFGAAVAALFEASVTLTDVTLTDNGLGVMIQNDAVVNATNLVVEDSYGSSYGGYGAVTSEGGVLNATGFVSLRNRGFGLLAAQNGGTLNLNDVVVTDTAYVDEGDGGYGIQVAEGGTLTGTGFVLERNHDSALGAGGGTVDIADFVARDTHPSDVTGYGRAATVAFGGSMTIDGLVAEGMTGVAVQAFGFGTTLSLTDATIRDVGGIATEAGEAGVGIDSGAHLVADGLIVDGATQSGLQLNEASADVANVEIRNGRPSFNGYYGRGISIQNGSSLTVNGALLEDNVDVGLIVSQDCTAELNDVTIRGTRPDLSPGTGHAVSLQLDSVVSVTNMLVEDSVRTGVFVSDAVVTIDGLTVRGTQPDAEVGIGSGLHVQVGSSVEASDVVIEDCIGQGIVVGTDGTTLSLDGVEIRGTQPLPDGIGGYALYAGLGSHLEVTNGTLDANLGAGLYVGQGSTAEFTDVEVLDMIGASTEGGGIGLLVQPAASFTGTRVTVADSDGVGVVNAEGDFDCTDCEVLRSGFASAVVFDGGFTMTGGALDTSVPTSDEGGGVGLFAWPFFGADVTLTDVTLANHPGPAVYLRGLVGSYVLDGVEVRDSGTLPFVPGAVVALEGVEPWDDDAGTGFLVVDSSFVDLPVSGVFFDASGGTLDGNSFSVDDPYEVWMQACDGAPPVEFAGDEPAHNDCAGAPRDLDPVLAFSLQLLALFDVQE